MAIENHPMSAMKGTPEAKALMAQVAGHKGAESPATGKASSNRDQATRVNDAAAGVAMPDGSYPIRNSQQLGDAVKDWVRTGRSLAVKSHIEKRARALDLPVPDGLTPAPKASDELDVAKSIASRK